MKIAAAAISILRILVSAEILNSPLAGLVKRDTHPCLRAELPGKGVVLRKYATRFNCCINERIFSVFSLDLGFSVVERDNSLERRLLAYLPYQEHARNI